MHVRTYDVFRRAVEEGVDYGWMRAHKHTDTPDADAVKDHIVQAILSDVCEVFEFDTPGQHG